MSGFTFGQPGGSASSSSGQTPSLFGTAGNTSSSGPFAAPSTGSQGQTSTPSLFGQKPAAGAAPAFGQNSASQSTSGSLFGSKPTGAAASTQTAQSGGLFGLTGGAGAAAPGGFFGGGANKSIGGANTTGSSASIFGGGGGGGATAPTPSSGGLFGQPAATTLGATTPNANKTSNLFGSTTPAGQPSSAANEQPKPGLFGAVGLGANSGSVPSSNNASTGGSGLFGAAPQQSSAGSTPNLFSGSTAQSQTAGAAKSPFGPPGGGLFPPSSSSSAPAVSVTPPAFATSTGATPAAGGPSLFGNPSQPAKPTTQSATPAVPAPPSTQSAPQNSGASLFTATASSQPASASTGAGAAKPSLFSQPAASSAAPAASAPATSAPTFTIGGTSQSVGNTTASSTAAPTTTAPAPSFTLGGGGQPAAGAASTAASGPEAVSSAAAATDATKKDAALGASTVGPKPTPQSRLQNKSMDEIITRWANDLQRYQKEFQTQAQKVADWDTQLVKSSEQIQKLYGSTLEAERATTEVERQLTAVENDQSEIEYWLEHYEKQVDELLASQAGAGGTAGEALQGPDADRERAFKSAEKLNERLTEMGKDLGSMVDEINDATKTLSSGAKADDPLSQIVRVLNGHLQQLQQIDQGTAQLQKKVTETQNASKNYGANSSLISNNAADDFYRSYIGRR